MLWTGNLVLFRVDDNIPLWKSNTSGTQAYKATMLSDGNLILTDKNSSQTFWSTGTSGNIGAILLVQDDGNLVVKTISGAIFWSSNSKSNCTGYYFFLISYCNDVVFQHFLVVYGLKMKLYITSNIQTSNFLKYHVIPKMIPAL